MPVRRLAPLLLAGIPSLFLFVCFVVPNAFLITTSFLRSDSQALTDEWTFDNYIALTRRPLYVHAIARTFEIGVEVGVLVVLLAYPLAFYLARTTSRHRNLLIAVSLSPLLASVVVRTYGWWCC